MKQVPKTDRIKALVAKAYGDPNVNTDGLAVFEAIIANNNPLRRPHGIYAGAVLQQDAMSEMADTINSDAHLPLQLMHRSGIPAGKVFHAEMKPTSNGGTQVNALFYLPQADAENVGKIDAGVINDVSVGFLPRGLQCSACGFDYLGDQSGMANVYDLTCDQGHTIGKDGVHARVHGVAAFSELSLVDRGAVPGASILPRPRQSAGVNPNMARFADLGIDERPFFLAASMAEFVAPTNHPKDKKAMDELIELKANLFVAERDAKAVALTLAAKDLSITDLTAKLTAATVETDKAKAELVAALATDGVKAKADLELAMGLVNEFGTATLSAIGTPEAKLSEVISERITAIRAARATLAMSLPGGGRAVPSTTVVEDKVANFAAYKRS